MPEQAPAMTIREVISAFGIVSAIVLAGISYGMQSAQLNDAREEIALLRQDVRAINEAFILWAQAHRD